VVRPTLAPLLANHGGLEDWVQESPILDLGSGSLRRRSCLRWWKISLHAFPACRGGEEEICGRSASFQGQHRRLSARCYLRFFSDELDHADNFLASVIFGRHGGNSTTSSEEALLPSRSSPVDSRWPAAKEFHRKWVFGRLRPVPRWRRLEQWRSHTFAV
jgi:hypothetical protein